jgi:primosomal protein N' (replication factor Y)
MAKAGAYKVASLKSRINNMFPDVQVVDMRQELAEGNRSIFSGALFEALHANVKRGKQSILFLNRRGHSSFVSCRKCGAVIKCVQCDVSLTFHSSSSSLVCHMCGKRIPMPDVCPSCGSKYIKLFGIGTQKVEDETRKLFPSEKIIRMDMDTTTGKHSHRDLLQSFRQGEASVLIGTQMIAKGLDFPNVTLVGVMAADISLNTGDFRAAENTFQLLTQVSGRAGRADSPGKVFIQTYSPEHYAVDYSMKQDYEGFYRQEIALRRQMGYPPFTHVFAFMFVGPVEGKLIGAAKKLKELMGDGDFEVLGPAPAQISRIKNKYRWKLIAKAVDEEYLKSLALESLDKLAASFDMTGVTASMTIDPSVIE